MWVIKLGGSLIGSHELNHWLEVVARLGDGKVIISPGGGGFADEVRRAQGLSHCDDKTAHRMAVMAMDQYAVMMSGINPSIAEASSELELAERGWQHRGIVWLPSKMVLADDTIPQHWDVTSDSLAAWLAYKMEAHHLLIVKSTKPAERESHVDKLQEQSLIDPCFKDFIQGKNFTSWVLDKTDYHVFNESFSEEKLASVATRILL